MRAWLLAALLLFIPLPLAAGPAGDALSALEAQVATLDARVQTLAGQIQADAQALQALQAQIATLDARITALETPPPLPPPSADVLIAPGEDAVAKVAAAPTGATILFVAGTHRLTGTVTPKAGQTLMGQLQHGTWASILMGSKPLTGWTKDGTATRWVVGGQTQDLGQSDSGGIDAGFSKANEDVFVDGARLQHVTSVSAATACACAFFDKAADKIYLGLDPTGRQVETSVRQTAIGGFAADVTLRDLAVRYFGTSAERGTIQTQGTRWTLQNVDASWNHGAGVMLAASSTAGAAHTIRGGRYCDNGWAGIFGGGYFQATRVPGPFVIEGAEICRNNAAHYNMWWGAAGMKLVWIDGVTLRGNYVHDNRGSGLWTDIDVIHLVAEQNRVEDNAGDGIFHEISYKATIRHNTVRRNGCGKYSGWMWGTNILVANSRDVEIHHNTVEVAATCGNGIGTLNQNRGGYPQVTNVYVHDNDITHLGDVGANGGAQDYGATLTRPNIRFEANRYHVPNTTGTRFSWTSGHAASAWSAWRAAGHEATGSLD